MVGSSDRAKSIEIGCAGKVTAALGVQLGLEGYQGLHIIGLAPL